MIILDVCKRIPVILHGHLSAVYQNLCHTVALIWGKCKFAVLSLLHIHSAIRIYLTICPGLRCNGIYGNLFLNYIKRCAN